MATKFGGRTVSGKFGVMTGADEGSVTKTVAPAKFSDTQMNTKIKARFGIECGSPHGTTFQEKCKTLFDNPDKPAPMKTPTKGGMSKDHSFEAVGTSK